MQGGESPEMMPHDAHAVDVEAPNSGSPQDMTPDMNSTFPQKTRSRHAISKLEVQNLIAEGEAYMKRTNAHIYSYNCIDEVEATHNNNNRDCNDESKAYIKRTNFHYDRNGSPIREA